MDIAGSPRNALRCSHGNTGGGDRALHGLGAKCWLPTPSKLRMPPRENVSETAGGKHPRQKGKKPNHQPKTPKNAESQKKNKSQNNQGSGVVRGNNLAVCVD